MNIQQSEVIIVLSSLLYITMPCAIYSQYLLSLYRPNVSMAICALVNDIIILVEVLPNELPNLVCMYRIAADQLHESN